MSASSLSKKLFILLTVIFSLGLQSCEKDYPDDIPKWLEKRIKELKRETRGKNKYGCPEAGVSCITIREFRIGESISYWECQGENTTCCKIYLEDARMLCEACLNYEDGIYYNILTETSDCSGYDLSSETQFIRMIWEEE